MYKYFKLLSDNIELNVFTEMLTIAFDNADYFSLTKNSCCRKSSDKCPVALELDPYLIQQFKTTHWHSYYVTKENPLLINIYKTNASTKQILSHSFDNLFLLNKEGFLDGYFEDICFFKGEELFIGSVSHESICNLYLKDNSSFYDDILSLAKWALCTENEISHLQREKIQLNLK
jgi:hypothetical protein